MGKPSAAPPAQPPAPQQQPAETNADKPVDKYKGTHVSRVIVSLARSRVGFQTPLGMLLGDIDSDLKPGEYKLKPVLAKQQWVVTGPNVLSGLRFDLSLEYANPWTLVYPDELPMTVATGSAEEPKTFGDAVDPATGKMKDPLAIFEGVPTLDPVSGIDDVEDVHYNLDYRSEKGGLSKFLQANYRDNSHRDINIDSISESTPKLFA